MSCVVPNVLERGDNGGKIAAAWWPAIDRSLIEGIKVGPASKRRAIKKVLRDFPELTRGDCWQRIRYLRKKPELAGLPDHGKPRASKPAKARRSAPRWTAADKSKLLDLAGYEPVKKIAQ